MSETIPFAVGVVLCALHPQDRTNAIIINETIKGDYVLLTDFGNIINIAVEDIGKYFEVSKNYVEALSIGWPLPTIAERIKHQIRLLDIAYSVVKQLECFAKQP